MHGGSLKLICKTNFASFSVPDISGFNSRYYTQTFTAVAAITEQATNFRWCSLLWEFLLIRKTDKKGCNKT